MLGDGSAVDAALVDYLLADAALAAALPDGAYIDEAPPGATRFIVATLIDHQDVAVMSGQDGYQQITYAIRAVGLATEITGPEMDAIAERLYVVLHDVQLPPVAGYGSVTISRATRIRLTVPDSIDKSLRWHHRGGQYIAHAS